jgi:hypothetical protein
MRQALQKHFAIWHAHTAAQHAEADGRTQHKVSELTQLRTMSKGWFM